jgi:hypothetical protein
MSEMLIISTATVEKKLGNAYKILMRTFHENSLFGKLRTKREDNFKINLKKYVVRSDLTEDRIH